MKNPISLVLLGDIAAGKGTQAKILARKYKLVYIGTGEFTRKVWHRRSLRKVQQGQLMPANLIKDFLRREITKLRAGKSVIVDGGKMPSEAQLIYCLFRTQKRQILAIYLTIPKNESFKRLVKRLKVDGRYDDHPEAVRNRVNYYRKIYSKTVRFWKGKKVLREIGGKGSVKDVTKRLTKAIEDYYGTD